MVLMLYTLIMQIIYEFSLHTRRASPKKTNGTASTSPSRILRIHFGQKCGVSNMCVCAQRVPNTCRNGCRICARITHFMFKSYANGTSRMCDFITRRFVPFPRSVQGESFLTTREYMCVFVYSQVLEYKTNEFCLKLQCHSSKTNQLCGIEKWGIRVD